MRLNLARSTIVFVGAWNVAIFSREWLSECTGLPRPEMEIAFANGRAIVSFTFSELVVQASDSQLVLSPLGGAPPLSNQIAERILDALPETPIAAFGINVCFDVTEPSQILDTTLSAPVPDPFERVGFHVASTAITRRLVGAGGSVVNLSLSRPVDPAVTQLDFNHHFDVEPKTARAARGRLAGQLDAAHRASVEIARTVFQLEVEQ